MERKPDIVIVNKMENTAIVVDVVILEDKRITDKDNWLAEQRFNICLCCVKQIMIIIIIIIIVIIKQTKMH